MLYLTFTARSVYTGPLVSVSPSNSMYAEPVPDVTVTASGMFFIKRLPGALTLSISVPLS